MKFSVYFILLSKHWAPLKTTFIYPIMMFLRDAGGVPPRSKTTTINERDEKCYQISFERDKHWIQNCSRRCPIGTPWAADGRKQEVVIMSRGNKHIDKINKETQVNIIFSENLCLSHITTQIIHANKKHHIVIHHHSYHAVTQYTLLRETIPPHTNNNNISTTTTTMGEASIMCPQRPNYRPHH